MTLSLEIDWTFLEELSTKYMLTIAVLVVVLVVLCLLFGRAKKCGGVGEGAEAGLNGGWKMRIGDLYLARFRQIIGVLKRKNWKGTELNFSVKPKMMLKQIEKCLKLV